MTLNCPFKPCNQLALVSSGVVSSRSMDAQLFEPLGVERRQKGPEAQRDTVTLRSQVETGETGVRQD